MGGALSQTTNVAASFLGQPKEFCILMLGLDDPGKTSLLNRVTGLELAIGTLPETTPTIGFNRESTLYGNNHITMWDVGGQDKIRPLWRSYLWNGHAFMFVVDATAPGRFPEAKEELHRLHEELNRRDDWHPLLVVASKMDVKADAVTLEEISRALDFDGLPKQGRRMALKGTTAMTNEGVDEVIQWFIANTGHAQIARHNENRKEIERLR